MELEFMDVLVERDRFLIRGSGRFTPGTHLVSGRVGSGKTTLAMIAAGLGKPDRGSVRRQGIGSAMLSMQFPEQHLTGSTLESEIASWHLDPDPVLALAGLSGREKDDPFSLSRGELKRLHLACIFSHPFDLLILDEPFSALDCREKMATADRIGSIRAGITIIFTHENQHLPRVDYLWEIREGSLVSLGSVPEALVGWKNKPGVLAELHKRGVYPKNLSTADILEAACRTHD
ncbi:MAG TPA: ATP-binding cassette domain-containing protein [Methanoregulaceae archaeon]|nr:ATP-binding cassette domain-containing protein [Methanoregulaceae archaeon]